MTFTPFVEPQQGSPECFWNSDPFDKYTPQPGFLTDLVYHMRGFEVPNMYVLWAGISLIGAVIKRDAWWTDGSRKIYPNTYVVLVGPAASGKSTAIDKVGKILTHPKFEVSIVSQYMKYRKRIKHIIGKATPESLLQIMKPQPLRDEKVIVGGEIIKIPDTSEIYLVSSELATFLGKQKYNSTLIPTLTDFYDPHEIYEENTIARGKVTLKKLCTSILGGVTESGFRTSIPPDALSEGFLSRVIPVFCRYAPPNEFPQVQTPFGSPETGELARRLARIAEGMTGGYSFTPGAARAYGAWYKDWKDRQRNGSEIVQKLEARLRDFIPKISLIIRAQRYANPQDKYITEDDVLDAIRILKATYAQAPMLIQTVEANDPLAIGYQKVKRYIMQRKRATRKIVLKNISGLTANMLDLIIDQLQQQEYIKIYMTDQKGREYPISAITRSAKETYIWQEDEDDET